MGATCHTIFNGCRIEIEYPRGILVDDPKNPGGLIPGKGSGLWKWTTRHPRRDESKSGWSHSKATALLSAQAAASDV